MKYILLSLLLVGCSYEPYKERCDEHVFTVTATGSCMFNEYGKGSCAVLLDGERKTSFQNPAVVGQKVIECRMVKSKDKSRPSYFKTVN